MQQYNYFTGYIKMKFYRPSTLIFRHCLPFTYAYVCLSIYTCIYKVYICICLYGTSLYYNFFFLISSLFAFYICMCVTLYVYIYIYVYIEHTHVYVYGTILYYTLSHFLLNLYSFCWSRVWAQTFVQIPLCVKCLCCLIF